MQLLALHSWTPVMLRASVSEGEASLATHAPRDRISEQMPNMSGKCGLQAQLAA
jgi:hypothetical protein